MEVFVGPTFTIDVSSSPPPPSDQTDGRRLFLNGVSEEKVPISFRISGPPNFFAGGSSESSSSIGTPDESDNDEDEVQSELKRRNGLCSFDSLEDSLPIKRGLSSHFEGKSKSFKDLSQVNNLKELKKQENPFNKRRRVLIASKFSRKSAFYSWSNPQSMPLLPVNEDNYEDNDDDYEDNEKIRKVPSGSSSSSSSNSLTEDKKVQEQENHGRMHESYAAEMRLRLRSFKSKSFSLADLQEHDDEEDYDDD